MPNIISTLSADLAIQLTEAVKRGDSVIYQKKGEPVIIRGGQKVMDKRSLYTPYNGVVTEISADELEAISGHPVFKRMIDRGFITIVNSDSRKVQESAANDMTPEDDGSQLTPDDFTNEAAMSDDGKVEINGKKYTPSGRKQSRKRNKKTI